jgi:hypothetical protein
MAESSGLFLPTTFPVIVEDPKELGVRLYQDIGFICRTINLKESGYYPQEEFITGQLFYPNPAVPLTDKNPETYRSSIRLTIDFGALPNNATKSVAHGINITNKYSFTKIMATASNPTALTFFPIGCKGTSIDVDATNVNITTTSNLTAYTIVIVILEFLNQ